VNWKNKCWSVWAQNAAPVLTSLISILINAAPAAQAQDAPDLPQPETNPLQGLFTPQPQYPTPQTIMNPDPVQPQGAKNQLQGMFTPQPQYVDPQTIMNPNPAQPQGEPNPLKGLFTPQPQYVTPQTIINPDPVPLHYQPPPPEPVEPTAATTAPGEGPTTTAPTKKPAETPGAKKPTKKPPAKKPKKAAPIPKDQPKDETPTVQLNPLRDAIIYLNAQEYQNCLASISGYLAKDPNNAEAHYIKAVTLVYLRQYTDAASEYRQTISLTKDPQLQQKAQDGLKKLGL
jgi:hypothetical protein